MSAVLIKGKREDLFRQITGVYHKWPDLERKIFTESHYRGQSLETISQSLNIDVQRVNTILTKCENELHSSLRNFRVDENCPNPFITNKFTGPIE